MSRVTSKDGTSIAYQRIGSGPAVILVGGALVDPATGRAGRWENAPLATELAARFTVYNYDRRGRADSGDILPYAVEREIEDIDALVAEAGGSAHLYGASSGGGLVLQAAAAGIAVDRLAVYEVPLGWPTLADARRLEALLGQGRGGDAVEHFMRTAGASEELIVSAKRSPLWPGLVAIAHTLAYDAACMGNGQPLTARLAAITRPTLVATGGASPGSFVGGGGDFFARAADAIAASIPRAERLTLDGQAHVADPRVLAPVLERFFGQ